MFRPERMSKVSVTGSKPVMGEVIEAIHDLNLVHLVDYDDSWSGFRPGDTAEGADELSEQLVTVRSIESILDVEEDDAGPDRIVTDEIDAEIEEIRQQVNELDDRRADLRDERREIDDRLSSVQPFATLGIDLDLLSGYDSLETAVVEGTDERIREALEESDDVEEYETFSEENVVAIFVYPEDDAENALDDALVGVEATMLSVPDVDASPQQYVSDLDQRKDRLDAELDDVEDELEELKREAAGFLLAVEEQLSIDAQKAEAPLSFATTEHSFIAEGWVPTERYERLETALIEEVGDHVECEELERVAYDAADRAHGPEAPEEELGGVDGERQPAATDGGEPRADGSGRSPSMHGEEPPVIQDNPEPVAPFETLTRLVNRPLYSELDPTMIFFLTFPALFGFMIGDLGYGILYFLISYGIYSRFDNDAVRGIGAVGMWAGGFTMLFGIFYGEVFGLHQLGELVWGGNPPIHKGLQPEYLAYAQLWIVISVLFGLAHLTAGYVFDFVETTRGHGLREAVFEAGSWLMMTLGLWIWVFSTHSEGIKPGFLFTVFNGEPVPLGFAGFPVIVGLAGLGLVFLGIVSLLVGEPLELIEILQVLTNVFSYVRLAAVVLAKAGLAFVVNLLVFGAYETGDGAFHFLFLSDEYASAAEVPSEELMFAGLVNGDGLALVIGAIAAVFVLVFGHLLVLGLGLTSAGLQAIRLEYVEYLSKAQSYEGGGDSYQPFGYERTRTSEE